MTIELTIDEVRAYFAAHRDDPVATGDHCPLLTVLIAKGVTNVHVGQLAFYEQDDDEMGEQKIWFMPWQRAFVRKVDAMVWEDVTGDVALAMLEIAVKETNG